MKEHPILFSGPMVRAILEGRKTQTRRVCMGGEPAKVYTFDQFRTDGFPRATFRLTGKPPMIPAPWRGSGKKMRALWIPTCGVRCIYGVPGDRLWVRETFFHLIDPYTNKVHGTAYGRDEELVRRQPALYWAGGIKWKPSIHMPRWASRLTLEVVGVRVERLQEISEADAKAEGVLLDGAEPATCRYGVPYRKLWDELNAERGFGWAQNPWVWVIEFKKTNNEEAACTRS